MVILSVPARAVLRSVLFVLFVGTVTNASAATYYVDFGGGSDNNNGTSTALAFKHCPGDSSAIGSAATTSLAPGDIVVFRGGVEYLGSVMLLWSGKSGQPIIYKGGSAIKWGSGRAIINGENIDSDARRFGFAAKSSQQYIVIQGFEFTLLGGHESISWSCGSLPSSVPGTGVHLVDCSDITVTDCYFHDIGDAENAVGMSLTIMEGWGVRLYRSATRIEVSHSEFTFVPMGVELEAKGMTIEEIDVHECDFHHNIRWSIAVIANGNNSTLQNINLHNNIIHDLWQYGSDSWLGCSGAARPHFDGIILYIGGLPYTGQSLGTREKPIRVHSNWFYNDDAKAEDAGTASVFLTGFGGTVLIYNNVFTNVLSNGWGGIYAQDGTTVADGNPLPDYHIYNNSFYDARRAISLRTLDSNYALSNGYISIKNNIFYNTSTAAMYMVETGLDGYSTPDEMDYNQYVTGRSDKKIASMYSGSRAYYNLAELQSAGFEKHGSYGDPLYNNVTGLGVNSSSNDLSIKMGSPCVDMGVNLSVFFTDDFLGVSRPFGKGWDIGAYEYRGAVSPSTPTKLRVKTP